MSDTWKFKGRRYNVVRVRTGSRLKMGMWIAWCQTLKGARATAAAQPEVEGYEIWIERLVDTKTGRKLGVPERMERVAGK